MDLLKITLVLLLLVLCSCKQKQTQHKIDPTAVELNKKTISLIKFLDNKDSCQKAIELLNKATEIDSTCFLCFQNKLMFYNQLGQFDQIILTNNKMIQLRPLAHDLYLNGGIYYEETGDSVTAKKYFEKSLEICNKVLDTMNGENRDFNMLLSNKAINLIMLDDSTNANPILKKLSNNQSDSLEAQRILSYMNKSKQELIQQLTKQ